jgi:hypothetical protein
VGDGQVVAQVGVVGNLDGFDLVFIAGADAVLLAGGYQYRRALITYNSQAKP